MPPLSQTVPVVTNADADLINLCNHLRMVEEILTAAPGSKSMQRVWRARVRRYFDSEVRLALIERLRERCE